MVELLKKIYHKFAHFTIVKKMGELYLLGTPIGNIRAYNELKKINKNRKTLTRCQTVSGEGVTDRKIRVAFIGQNIQVWGKIAPVYEKLIHDPRFVVRLYAVKDIVDGNSNKTYEYFAGQYNNVIAVDETGSCAQDKDLKDFKPDYVFLTRPYDQYLPKNYRSDVIAKYSKVCYCSYTFILTYTNLNDCYSKIFARNVSIFFADNKFMRNRNIRRFSKAHSEGIMKSVFLGYPIMSNLSKKIEKEENSKLSILWTPRWSQSAETGGGNMLKYKDAIVEYARKRDDIRLIYRPHPLAFHHFVETGEMTQQEVDEYLSIYTGDKFVYDNEAEYIISFANADILLSDISSMICEFYITGKPIVYCDTGAKTLPVMDRLLEGCYITKTWKEVEDTIEKLRTGEDPLRSTRAEIAKEVFGDNLSRIPDRFVEYIVKDFRKG